MGKTKARYLHPFIKKNLSKKVVFLGGPRQIGKTTLSLEFIAPKSQKSPAYLNWDLASDKQKILKNELPLNSKMVIFDEIHKYKNWRSLIKGLYDKYKGTIKFLVTGSARLDYFRKGGDSLIGRYRYYRLHPFTLPELSKRPSSEIVERLMNFSGFPEPYLLANVNEHRLWQRERVTKVITEDLRDLENVKDNSLLLLLAEILPTKVGSPLSLKSLEEDLQVSQPTIARWLKIFSTLYYSYEVAPFGSPKIRAVKKLQKIYLWDWSQVEGVGPRFENLVAGHLLKYCHFIEDTQGFSMELRYLRDTDGREIDFVVLQNKIPLFAVECKTGEKQLSKSIPYFADRTNIPKFYQVHLGSKDYGHEKTGRVLPFAKFCFEVPLV